MNRKARRAAFKENRRDTMAALHTREQAINDLVSQARDAYQRNELTRARDLCRLVLAREPSHAIGNNLLGAVLQSQGDDKAAIRYLARAIALEDSAVFHYNIAFSYQRLKRWDDAVMHFTRAIALRMDGKSVEDFIMQYPVVTDCLDRIAQQWPRRLTLDALFGDAGVAAIADDAFLRCALEKTELASLELENFLATIRFALLQQAVKAAPETAAIEDRVLGFYAALAQQCFISEYVLAQSEDETLQAQVLRDRLLEQSVAGGAIEPLLLIAVAAYFPLHRLPAAAALRNQDWSRALDGLLRQQLDEPLQESELRGAIPPLTAIANEVSIEVRRQYEENPYPRWAMIPDLSLADGWRTRFPSRPGSTGKLEVLVAGCGTGQHPIQTAQQLPDARVLAIDLSADSLAYALRKTREAGIRTIAYAQADILELRSIGRNFDRIESVGVLHHLADPKAGWHVLLSLLRPGGIMDIGLYSETARRAIVAARSMIAERRYRATTEDIRLFRHELRRLPDGGLERGLTSLKDFYTTSGCRDLLFHVMEHRFTIPDIAAFLSENGLTFLGFRLGAGMLDQFSAQFPDPDALTDLDCWHAFEQANPQTFLAMYRFAVRKDR